MCGYFGCFGDGLGDFTFRSFLVVFRVLEPGRGGGEMLEGVLGMFFVAFEVALFKWEFR